LVSLNALNDPWPRGKLADHRSWDLGQRPSESGEQNEATSSKYLCCHGIDQQSTDAAHDGSLLERRLDSRVDLLSLKRVLRCAIAVSYTADCGSVSGAVHRCNAIGLLTT